MCSPKQTNVFHAISYCYSMLSSWKCLLGAQTKCVLEIQQKSKPAGDIRFFSLWLVGVQYCRTIYLVDTLKGSCTSFQSDVTPVRSVRPYSTTYLLLFELYCTGAVLRVHGTRRQREEENLTPGNDDERSRDWIKNQDDRRPISSCLLLMVITTIELK